MLGLWDLPPEALALLRYGRTIDNTRYKRAGFRYGYTSAGTVEAFAQGLRLAGTVGDEQPDVPLRARGRGLLPPLPRRRARQLRSVMEHVRVDQRDAVAVVTLSTSSVATR